MADKTEIANQILQDIQTHFSQPEIDFVLLGWYGNVIKIYNFPLPIYPFSCTGFVVVKNDAMNGPSTPEEITSQIMEFLVTCEERSLELIYSPVGAQSFEEKLAETKAETIAEFSANDVI